MKLAKMSLAAALLLGVNAYAIDNVKVNGNAKLFYQTVENDASGSPDIFDKDASNADFALQLNVSADLSDSLSAGASYIAVSTLGAENNLVSGTWSNAHSATTGTGASFLNAAPHNGAQVDDASWFSEAWMAFKGGNTTAKLGRQALDTPLVFTETWGIDQNTFEAAVLMNQDLPDTTLVAAWVGKSNGRADDQGGVLNTLGATAAGYVAEGGKFSTFQTNGAYAAGLINNSVEPLTFQAWYYNLPRTAQAHWVQADIDANGILAGAQCAGINSEATNAEDDQAYAFMLGYAMKDTFTVKAAYSLVDDKGTHGFANLATGTGNGGQTQLYTEMWWWYGTVSDTGAETYTVSLETTVGNGYDVYLGYWNSDVGANGASDNRVVDEVAFTISKSYGALDTTVAILWDDIDYDVAATTDEQYTTAQLYLTYNF